MKDFNINTKRNIICSDHINYEYLFTSFSGNTNNNFTSTSTNYINNEIEYITKKKPTIFYTINLDWFQFVCSSDRNGNLLESYSTERIHIRKNQTNNNPNFRYRYTVMLDNIVLCEIFAVPNNCRHKKNEISVKLNNAQLYTTDWSDRIQYFIYELKFCFISLTKIDIALDGTDIYKKMNLFFRYILRDTIQINNTNLEIEATKFKKSDKKKWRSYTIGSKAYQKSAIIYEKSNEIKISGKTYISDFWLENGIDTNVKIGRFELKLGNRHLKKYRYNSFNDFCNPEFIGKILYDEVTPWLKFYQVSLKDSKIYRKDIAISHGKEKVFIHWNKVPKTTIQLEKVNHISDGIHEAKRVVTHTISEILKEYSTDSTNTLIDFIEVTTTKYQIFVSTIRKIETAIKESPSFSVEFNSLIDRLKHHSTINLSNGCNDNYKIN